MPLLYKNKKLSQCKKNSFHNALCLHDIHKNIPNSKSCNLKGGLDETSWLSPLPDDTRDPQGSLATDDNEEVATCIHANYKERNKM